MSLKQSKPPALVRSQQPSQSGHESGDQEALDTDNVTTTTATTANASTSTDNTGTTVTAQFLHKGLFAHVVHVLKFMALMRMRSQGDPCTNCGQHHLAWPKGLPNPAGLGTCQGTTTTQGATTNQNAATKGSCNTSRASRSSRTNSSSSSSGTSTPLPEPPSENVVALTPHMAQVVLRLAKCSPFHYPSDAVRSFGMHAVLVHRGTWSHALLPDEAQLYREMLQHLGNICTPTPLPVINHHQQQHQQDGGAVDPWIPCRCSTEPSQPCSTPGLTVWHAGAPVCHVVDIDIQQHIQQYFPEKLKVVCMVRARARMAVL